MIFAVPVFAWKKGKMKKKTKTHPNTMFLPTFHGWSKNLIKSIKLIDPFDTDFSHLYISLINRVFESLEKSLSQNLSKL